MKFYCKSDGVHFPNEFKQTLKCTFWQDRGLGDISDKRKKQLWDWLCSFNFDEFAIKTGYGIDFEWNGRPYYGNDFEKVVPNYSKLSEEKKKDFQKQWFDFLNKKAADLQTDIFMQYFIQQVWKK